LELGKTGNPFLKKHYQLYVNNNAPNKRIVVSVISDIETDARVQKVCNYLHKKNVEVILIGRKLKNSLPLSSYPYKVIRLKTIFEKGIIQYVEFTLKLWLKLFSYKATIYLSNDLDTLLPNFLHSFFRKKALVYDSHEFFTGVPELMNSPIKRNLWKFLEKILLPKIKYGYTVNESIQKLYKSMYGVNLKVVKNVPLYDAKNTFTKINYDIDPFILNMQGAGINKDRGYEEAIEAMQYLPNNFILQIIGDGTVLNELKELVAKLKLQSKVIFISKVSPIVLKEYTKKANLGLSLDKSICLNGLYSLPNKLFNFIHVGVPVLASHLPEVKKIIDHYNVGICVNEVTAQTIATAIIKLFEDKALLLLFNHNTQKAARELCWQNEEKVLNSIYDELLNA
jgi:glycosyltransferase involved in cell wall biosynthesis